MPTKEELIQQCRYYKGEKTNPFAEELRKHEVNKDHLPPPECMKTEYKDLSNEALRSLQSSSWFWPYEAMWVDLNAQGLTDDIKTLEAEGEQLIDNKVITKDNTPLSLLAIIYNRYIHCGGSHDGFKEFYKRY